MRARILASVTSPKHDHLRAALSAEAESVLVDTLDAQSADDLTGLWARVVALWPHATTSALCLLVAEWSRRAEVVGLTPVALQLLVASGLAPDARTRRACAEALS